MKIFKNKIVIVLLIISSILFIYSSPGLRLWKAEYYKNKNDYVRAAVTYEEILRKNTVKKYLNKKIFTKINYELGNAYCQIKLKNLSIEKYAEFAKNSQNFELSYFDLNKDKNTIYFLIGIIEAGRWNDSIYLIDKIIKESKNEINSIRLQKFLNVAISLKNQKVTLGNKDFLFRIGDSYIENQLFEEARDFYTKRILDYGEDIFKVLQYLENKYKDNIEIKKEVWGDNFYAVIEDFEGTDIKLSNWVRITKAKVNSHYLESKITNQGNYSEYLDLGYENNLREGIYDYWAKRTNLELNKANLKFGIRAFIKSQEPSRCLLGLNIIYPKKDTSGVYVSLIIKDTKDGWQEYRTRELLDCATFRFSENWDKREAIVDKIIIDTQGIKNKILIDEIELFIIED